MASKLKSCSACGKEIGSKVKKCIHCGTDQRSWFRRHKFLSGIGIFFLLSLASVLGEDSSVDPSISLSEETNEVEAEQPEETIYTVGDVVTINDEFELTVTDVEVKETVGTEIFTEGASEGGIFVAVNYSLKNISDEPAGLFSIPSVHLLDEKGTEYSSDIDASASYATEKNNDAKILSDLNPGISTNDSSVFEVSKELYEQGDWFISIDGDYKVELN